MPKVVAFLLVLSAVLDGCVALAQSRERLDRIWDGWMLAGHYGVWEDGRERPWSIAREDKIVSYPVGAHLTKYGIVVNGSGGLVGTDWNISGGLIGRAQPPGAAIELFGKEIVRVHLPLRTAKYGRDYSYEFLLVVRPAGAGKGRLIKRWLFPPEAIALYVDPWIEARIRERSSSREAADKEIAQNKHHVVDGFLRFDPATQVATVTITGLNDPFEERVNLSNELRP